mgnify:CR=1 FL=1
MDTLPVYDRGRSVESLSFDPSVLGIEHETGVIELPIKLATYAARRDFMAVLQRYMLESEAFQKRVDEAAADTALAKTKQMIEFAAMTLQFRFRQLEAIIDVRRLDDATRAIIEHPDFCDSVAVDEVAAIVDRFQSRFKIAG